MLAVLVVGAMLGWHSARSHDRRMRDQLLQQAQQIASALDLEAVEQLTGTAADEASPFYQRLKLQFQLTRQALPDCRYLYLMGRDEQGQVFFYLDSESANSGDESPPGQIYDEASAVAHGLFTRGRAQTEGPLADRWGVWVSAFVPILDAGDHHRLAVLGVDVAADLWQRRVLVHTLPVLLATLAIVIIILMGALWLYRCRQREIESRMHWTGRHVERGIALAIGSVLSLLLAVEFDQYERDHKQDAFAWLALNKARDVAKSLMNVEDVKLEGLSSLFLASDRVNYAEFQTFSDFMKADAVMAQWAWVPMVRPESRADLETRAHRDGQAEFVVWENGPAGEPVAAATRELHYPVLYVLHRESGPLAAGMDLAADPVLRKALEAAASLGSHTVMTPLQAGAQPEEVQDMEKVQDMLVIRPVMGHSLETIQGFVIGVLRLNRALGRLARLTEDESNLIALDIFRMRTDAPPQLLASTQANANGDLSQSLNSDFGLLQPVHVFGQVFIVVARPGPDFAALLPMREGLLAGLVGLGLTLLLAGFVGTMENRRLTLEEQVRLRTAVLQESERSKKVLLTNLPGMAYRCENDEYWTMRFVSQGCVDLTGYQPEQLIDNRDISYAELIDPEHRPMVRQAWDRALEAGTVCKVEYMIRTLSGERRWVWEQGRPIHGAGGEVVALEGFITDVTQRRQAEKRIRHLNQVLRSIRHINQLIVREEERGALIRKVCRMLVEERSYLTALIVLCNDQGRPTHWAQAGLDAAFEGLVPQLEAGQLPPCDVWLGTADGGPYVSCINSCADCPLAGIHQSTGATHVMGIRLRHGQEKLGFLMVSGDDLLGLESEEQALFTEMVDDVAYGLWAIATHEAQQLAEQARLSLEGQLLQAQKMEAVGRLAGGVAHDFNNMLSVIIGYTELAMSEVEPTAKLHDRLRAILQAGRHSADLTRQLLAFARRQAIRPILLDLNDTVAGSLKMLGRLIGEQVELVWKPAHRSDLVLIDPTQLDQVLANLVVNARDAISEVGKITIETDNVELDESFGGGQAGFTPGRYMMLSISDNGCGIEAGHLDNIFDPFFTTKDQGKGTGLGLAIVYGIVKQNHGFIDVTSEPGAGTRFRLFFPCREDSLPQSTTGEAAQPPRGTETILLVEDEPALLELCQRLLEQLGYTVLPVNSPGRALELAVTTKARIDLLLTDMIMPEMNGRDLWLRVRPLRPEMKALFMSGYTANVLSEEEGLMFLQKPFRVEELADRVRQAIDGCMIADKH